jgi:hypothetical protein
MYIQGNVFIWDCVCFYCISDLSMCFASVAPWRMIDYVYILFFSCSLVCRKDMYAHCRNLIAKWCARAWTCRQSGLVYLGSMVCLVCAGHVHCAVRGGAIHICTCV